MNRFKIFLKEESNKKLNDVLLKYVNGDVPDDYENQQENPIELFKQLDDIIAKNGFPYVIMHDGKPFAGSGIVVKEKVPYHFDLVDQSGKKVGKLHIELKKNDDGMYFFSYVRTE